MTARRTIKKVGYCQFCNELVQPALHHNDHYVKDKRGGMRFFHEECYYRYCKLGLER